MKLNNILGGFTRTLAKLDKFVEQEKVTQEVKESKIEALEAELATSVLEVHMAEGVASNIKALLQR